MISHSCCYPCIYKRSRSASSGTGQTSNTNVYISASRESSRVEGFCLPSGQNILGKQKCSRGWRAVSWSRVAFPVLLVSLWPWTFSVQCSHPCALLLDRTLAKWFAVLRWVMAREVRWRRQLRNHAQSAVWKQTWVESQQRQGGFSRLHGKKAAALCKDWSTHVLSSFSVKSSARVRAS